MEVFHCQKFIHTEATHEVSNVFSLFCHPSQSVSFETGSAKALGKNDFNFLRYRLTWMETGKPYSKLQIRLQKSKIVWPILWIGNVGRRCNLSKYSELHSQNRKLWASTYVSSKLIIIIVLNHLQYERIWNGILWLLWGILGQDECQPHLEPVEQSLLAPTDPFDLTDFWR